MKWLLIYTVSSMTNLLPATPAGCNPSLDLLFTLGSESYLDFAERIIGDLARQPLPPYTIQTGFSICDNSSVAFIPLMSRFVQVMTSIKTISKGLLAESRLRHEQKISYSNKQCLQVSKDIFQRSPRNNVPKMLIFVTDGTGWASLIMPETQPS
ncbi:hypothetical protein SNE40_018643 [Patella caerulea]|uniref:Uncharacterized protein n=1 Tax=Patella caerulea TaxID=87958 RepID=A0AAN8PGW7_PATCE